MKTWIPSAAIYQVNLRSLAAREPRNAIEAAVEKPTDVSPLAYVTKHLGVLRKLGVTVLHLMPPYSMGIASRKGIGSPYAARDYHAIDSEYGTLDEFKDLLAEAHRRDMKVIIGMVPNHTSRDHVWVTNNPSYYVSDGEGTIVYDLDWTDTAKLNYLDPGLRREMTETYDHWLSILGTNEDGQPDGVDGFRVDMAHFINDLSFWNEALPELRQRHAGRELLFLAECYGTENSLDLFTRGFNAAYDDLLYKVWELFYGRDADGASILLPDPELPSNTDFADLYQQYLSGGIAAVIRHVFSEYEARLGAMNEPHYFARYTDNHDEGRGVYRFGPEATWAMFQLIAFSRSGLPFLLTGQEFGAANRPSIHERIGPCDKGYRTRTEDGIVKREGVEFEGNLFARGREARQALYENYKSVLAFRRKHRALIDGPIDFIDCEEDAPPTTHTVVAFSRGKGKRALRCAVNMGSEDRVLGADAFREGEALYGHCPEGLLPAFSAVVMR